MAELITLIKRAYNKPDVRHEVLCGVRSIGQSEFYQASATEYHPELKVILADYLDYNGENLADYNGVRYRVFRAYRAGREMELTLERAPREDGVAGG